MKDFPSSNDLKNKILSNMNAKRDEYLVVILQKLELANSFNITVDLDYKLNFDEETKQQISHFLTLKGYSKITFHEYNLDDPREPYSCCRLTFSV